MDAIELQRGQEAVVPDPVDIVLILLMSYLLLDHSFTTQFATATLEGTAYAIP